MIKSGLPIINKMGYAQNWRQILFKKFNFKKLFYKIKFIEFFFLSIILDKYFFLFKKNRFYKYNNELKNWKKYFNLFFKNKSFKKSKIFINTTSTWILKYQECTLFLFFYDNIKLKQKKKRFFKRKKRFFKRKKRFFKRKL
jgi:hypothetical protein